MKMKSFLAIFIILGLAGCQLANRLPRDFTAPGTASLSLNLIFPVQETPDSSSSRYLAGDTQLVEVMLYRPFQGDSLSADSVPSSSQIEAVSQNSFEVHYGSISISSSGTLEYTFMDLPLGEWNLVTGTFRGTEALWRNESLDNMGPLSYGLIAGLELEAGTNSIAITLKPNTEYIDHLLDADSFPDYVEIAQSDILEAQEYKLKNLPLGTVTIAPDTLLTLPDDLSLVLYNPQGERITAAADNSWTVKVETSGEIYLLVIEGTSRLAMTELSTLRIAPLLESSESGNRITLGLSIYTPAQLNVSLSGFLPDSSYMVKLLAYKPFAEDTLAGGTIRPKETDIANIKTNTEYVEYEWLYSASQPVAFSGIMLDPEAWNVLAGVFDNNTISTGGSWTESNAAEGTLVPSAISTAYIANALLSTENSTDLSMLLQANIERQPQNIIDIEYTGEISKDVGWDNRADSILIYLTNIPAGTNTLLLNTTESLSTYWSSVVFYSMDGTIQNLTETSTGTTSSWVYNSSSINDYLIMEIIPSGSSYSSMNLNFAYDFQGNIWMTLDVYVDVTLNLNGMILPGTEAIALLAYPATAAEINPSLTDFQTTVDSYKTTYGAAEYVVDSADISANSLILKDFASGDYNLLIAAVGSDVYSQGDNSVNWQVYDNNSGSNLFSAITYQSLTGAAVSLNSLTLNTVLSPNKIRYYNNSLTADISSSATINWNHELPYTYLFISGFTDGADYPLHYQTGDNTNYQVFFSSIEIYNSSGALVDITPLTDIVIDPAYGFNTIATDWNYTNASAAEELALVFEPNTEMFTAQDNLNIYPYTDGAGKVEIYGGSESSVNPDNIMLNLTGPLTLEGDYSEVIFYKPFAGDTLTPGVPPSQDDLLNILNNTMAVTTLGANGSIYLDTGTNTLVVNAKGFVQPGWNALAVTFPDYTQTSWNEDTSDLTGATVSIPGYFSYAFGQSVVIDSQNLTLSLQTRLNIEHFLYEGFNVNGTTWGSAPDNSFLVQDDTVNAIAADTEAITVLDPAVILLSNLTSGTAQHIYVDYSIYSDTILEFFDMQGNPIDIGTMYESSNPQGTYYFAFTPSAGQENLIMTIAKSNASNIVAPEFQYYLNDGSFSTFPYADASTGTYNNGSDDFYYLGYLTVVETAAF